MSPLVLSGSLFAAGLLIGVVGRVLRRGSHPVCRRCGFHLAGLHDRAACPECGRVLGVRRAIATGDRRRWPTPVGVTLIGLSVLTLGYAILDNPAMDQRKPVWLLAAEHRLFGDAREARLLDELERRTAAVPTREAERIALAEMALAGTDSIEADARWHGLVVRALNVGTLPPDRASPHVESMLRDYAQMDTEHAQRFAGIAADYARLPNDSDAAIQPLLSRVGKDYASAALQGTDAVDDWLESEPRRVLSQWVQTNHASLSQASLDQIVGDFDWVALRVKPRVAIGDRLPIRIDMEPRLLAFGDPMWLHTELLEVRIGGQTIKRIGRSRGASGMFGMGNQGSSALMQYEEIPQGIPLGEVGVEVDVEFAISFEKDSPGEAPPGRVLTRQTRFELVEARDAVAWAESADPDDHRRLLESISVIDLYYFFGDSSGETYRWGFPIEVRELPFDLAHALWAEQGDRRWKLGTIPLKAGANWGTRMNGPRDRRTVNETVHPDPALPVRLTLEPDAELVSRRVETLNPWPHPIELGEFAIIESDQWGSYSTSSADFRPPPAIEALGEPGAEN